MLNLYSLWIIPSPDTKKRLKKIIIKLSKKYDGPVFEPHMTLLGNIQSEESECVKNTKVLASQIKPFSITFGDISFSTTYFQSVFLRIKSSAELMEVNLRAKKLFNLNNNVFMPHISLLYGNFDMKMREKVSSRIHLPDKLSFKVKQIIVTPSTENPSEWKHLTEIGI